ncbi:MAG: nickel-dependent lactate racemase [Anaerolineales bacterium]|nr:nickel-dependent lactate racemase [Anaerolineales bacterium]
MIEVELAYGHGVQRVAIEQSQLLGIYAPADAEEQLLSEGEIVRRALATPIDSPCLRQLVRPGQRVAIVASDLTRPCPSEKLLPPVLDDLTAAGIPDRDITIVAALGLHRPMTEEELERMVGTEVYNRIRVINHNPEDTVALGRTRRGTPVQFFRPVVEAGARICLGNIEFHYFAGYSGGAKAILPGCASRAAITANHAMMVETNATGGRIEGNPVRADLEEGVAMLGVDFILNVMVGPDHQIKAAVAGEVTAAHRKGCEWVSRRGKVTLPRAADIVLVSAGGFPKDINLYQAQKALDNAAYAVRNGGAIILLAECIEGFGNPIFETWLRETSSPDEILKRIQAEFILGGHKAAAVATVLKRTRVYLVSSLPPTLVKECGMLPYDQAEKALQKELVVQEDRVAIAVLPQGGSVLPTIRWT